MSLADVRSAVALAHRLVVTSPSSATAAPHPVTIHQPAWLASAKPSFSGTCSAESTAEPMTATPSAEPTCRLVEAMAAAAPVRERGMLETAQFVIAGLTRPQPMPKAR